MTLQNFAEHPDIFFFDKFYQMCVNICAITKCNMSYLLKRVDGCLGKTDDIHTP